VISGAGGLDPTATPQVDHTYLCYSKFEQDGGMVATADQAPALIALGMWQPSAIKGNLPDGPNVENVGGYHLSCNPPATMLPTGFYADNNGVLYDASYATTEAKIGVYPVVA
jgi:hypothetical protein